jgi:hypothetical protein
LREPRRDVRGWTCPDCRRRFGRANQSHGCAPAMTIDDYFASRPRAFRRIHEAVVRHLAKLGPIVVDAVAVGILIKKTRTFAELRPKRDRLVLAVLVSDPIEHPRVTRVLRLSANRSACYVDLFDAKDVDGDVRDWLAQAYFGSPD